MTKDEQISFLKSTCSGIEQQIVKLKERIKEGDHRVVAGITGALNDAEQSLHKHQHKLKELTGG